MDHAAAPNAAQASTNARPSAGAVACQGRRISTPNSTTQASCDRAISREVRLAGVVAAVTGPDTASPDAGADAPPSDVGDEREGAIRLGAAAIGVVHEERASAHVLAGHEPPVPAVLRLVAVVAHHEVTLRRNDERAPVVVGRLRRGGAEA